MEREAPYSLRSRIGWFLASWFPGHWIRLGNESYRVDRDDVEKRGRFKPGV